MYKIYTESNNLSISTTNKIQAIQIAKQWIEAFTNIRDTNWLIFSSDYNNCWNTLNYNTSCIWDSSSTNKIAHNKNYKIYKDSNNKWTLNYISIAWLYNISNSDYRSNYRIWLDTNWIYTQTWTTKELKPFFTRNIKVMYIDTNWWLPEATDNKLKVISTVEWSDNTSTTPRKIEMEKVLTNWKK